MSLLQGILEAQGGAMVDKLAGQFGLDKRQAEAALAQLVPALGKGVSGNVAREGGIAGLVNALSTGNHAKYVDEPERLSSADTVADGKAILGHLFGSKEVSREVARRGAEKTGIGDDVLKQMLPIVATMVMGTLSKQRTEPGGGPADLLGGNQTGAKPDLLTSFLDADGDGSIADDVMGMLFRR